MELGVVFEYGGSIKLKLSSGRVTLLDMCQGLRFEVRFIGERELESFCDVSQIRAIKQKNVVEQQFWQPQAYLPIYTKTGPQLKLWGNKSKYLELPQTSWAKLESIKAGNWEIFNPKPVLIMASACLDSKVWLELADGLTGLMVRADGQDMVYVVTRPADEAYTKVTGQARQPLGNFIYPK